MRKRYLVTAVVVVVVVVAGVAAVRACGGGRGSVHRPLPDVVEAARAPDGGVLRVSEYGSSSVIDNVSFFSFGAIVENTSAEYVALGAGVAFQFFDASGNRTRLGNSRPYDEIREHATLIPAGGRKAVAAEESFANSGLTPAPAKVTATVGDTQVWVRATLLPAMQVSNVRLGTMGNGAAIISFALSSEFPTTNEWPDTVFIYRDAAGSVVGGRALASVTVSPKKPQREWPQGRSEQQIEVPQPTPVVRRGFDVARTELFFNPPEPRTDKHGKPLHW